MALQLHNPHSVAAALATRPKDVLQINLPGSVLARAQKSSGDEGDEDEGDAWERVARLARANGVRIIESSAGGRPQGKRDSAPVGGRVSAASAQVKERAGVSLEELFSRAKERKGGRGLWIALDSLQDPQNLGAIFRTSAFFGVEGILLTQERSAPLSAAAYDVASGGLEHVPFTLQVNLQRAFEAAKEAGLWILGTSEHARESLAKVEADRPWLLVLGNEERGIRRLTREACDVVCGIPAARQDSVTSLNVSVAAGVCISHLSFRPSRSS